MDFALWDIYVYMPDSKPSGSRTFICSHTAWPEIPESISRQVLCCAWFTAGIKSGPWFQGQGASVPSTNHFFNMKKSWWALFGLLRKPECIQVYMQVFPVSQICPCPIQVRKIIQEKGLSTFPIHAMVLIGTQHCIHKNWEELATHIWLLTG